MDKGRVDLYARLNQFNLSEVGPPGLVIEVWSTRTGAQDLLRSGLVFGPDSNSRVGGRILGNAPAIRLPEVRGVKSEWDQE